MNENNTRAKIEIRLELRQLVLLSLGTMTFSGSLFAIGYYLGTRDGLRSVVSPVTEVVQVETPREGKRRARVRPTKAALGEVEFLFAKPTPKKKHLKAERPQIVKQVESLSVNRRLPKLKSRSSRKASAKFDVELPALPAVPVRIATASKGSGVVGKAVSADSVQPAKAPKMIKSAPSHEVVAKKMSLNDLSETVKSELLATPQKAALPKPKPAVKVMIDNQPDPKQVVAKVTATPARTKPAVEPRKTAGAPKTGPFFTVQVKAVTEKEEADKFSAELRSHGFQPNIVLADIPEKGRYYRIRLGKFSSMDEARRFQRQIRGKGMAKMGGFVTRY